MSGALSFADLEQLWVQAGGDPRWAPTMAGIAWAESGGNPDAAYPGETIAPGTGSANDATGLWQILGLPAGNFTAAELTNPLDNAKMAVAKFDQSEGAGATGLDPWTGDAFVDAIGGPNNGPVSREQAISTLEHLGAPSSFLSGASSYDPTGSGSSRAELTSDDKSLPGILSRLVQSILGLGDPTSGLFAPFSNLFVILAWITQPLNWLRIFAGVAGLLLGIGGVVAMTGVF